MRREDLKNLSREQLERLICEWIIKYHDLDAERIRLTRERDDLIDERNNLLKNSKAYDLLCKLGDGREFEVIYDRLVEDEKPEEFIYTNAYANKNRRKPSVYMQKRRFGDDDYHDSELFRGGDSELEVVVGTDEIDKIFAHRSKEKRNKNKSKYSQYIAIPVFCNDEKMIGLFEIVCLNRTKIGDTKEEIEEIVSRYFIPYSFLLLVLHKLEKALLAKPI